MTTWGDLRASVREELKDTNEEKYRWSDNLLYLYLKDALNDYSLWFPVREDRAVLELSGTGYPLPSNHVNTLFVECPKDSYLERRKARPGIRYPARSGKPFLFYTQGGKIYLDSFPLSGDEVLLTYEKVHPAPGTDEDVTSSLVCLVDAHDYTAGFAQPSVPIELIVTGVPAGATQDGIVKITGTDEADEALTDIEFQLDEDSGVQDSAYSVFKTIAKVVTPAWNTDGDVIKVGCIAGDHILTVPVNDEELLRLYVLAKCYGHMRSRQSALDRFKDRSSSGSTRQDNPLHPETKSLMDEYYEKLNARIGGGTIRLYRTGRIR